jgi:hypothetical protein
MGIDLRRIALDDAQLARKRSASSSSAGRQRRSISTAVTCAPARSRRGSIRRGRGRPRTPFPVQIAGQRGDAIEQLLVEQEVLPQRLGGLKPVARDDIAQRRGSGTLGSVIAGQLGV